MTGVVANIAGLTCCVDQDHFGTRRWHRRIIGRRDERFDSARGNRSRSSSNEDECIAVSYALSVCRLPVTFFVGVTEPGGFDGPHVLRHPREQRRIPRRPTRPARTVPCAGSMLATSTRSPDQSPGLALVVA